MGEFGSGVMVGIFLGGLVAGIALRDITFATDKDVVAHGCAHYDAQTGAFTWNDEGKK